MKKRFLNFSLGLIRKYNDYDDIKMDELRYGLEGFYLTMTKMVVIVTLAIYLNLVFEMLLMLIFFNILRTSAFGLHASKSWICLLSSSTIFIGCPMIAKIIVIPNAIKIILGIISIILIYIYAPADTHKHPLIYADKRKKLKIQSTIRCLILITISLVINNNTISNLILLGTYTEIVLILPLTYKTFKLPYNNYKTYILENS